MAWYGARVRLYPYSSPVSYTNTPIDISSAVSRIATGRGKSFVLDDFDTGTATVVLDNSSGIYTPGNTGMVVNLLPGNIARPGRLTRDVSAFTSQLNTVTWSTVGGSQSPYISANVPASAPTGKYLKPVNLVDFVAVTPGLAYSARVSAWYEGSGSGSKARTNITWLDSNYSVLSTVNGSDVTLSTSATNVAVNNATAPAGAAWAYPWTETRAVVASAYTWDVGAWVFMQGTNTTGADFPGNVWPWLDINSVVDIQLGTSTGGWKTVFTGTIDDVSGGNDNGSPELATATLKLSTFEKYLATITLPLPSDAFDTGKGIATPVLTLPLDDVNVASTSVGAKVLGGTVQGNNSRGTLTFGSPGPSDGSGTACALVPYSTTKGKAFSLDGAAATLSSSGNYILMGAFQCSTAPSAGTSYILSAVSMSGASVDYTNWSASELSIDSSGRLCFGAANYTGNLCDGKWHHVALIKTSTFTYMQLWVDGVYVTDLYVNLIPGGGFTIINWTFGGRDQSQVNYWKGINTGSKDNAYFNGSLSRWGFYTCSSGNEITAVKQHMGAATVGRFCDGQTEVQRLNTIQGLAGMATTTPSVTSVCTISGIDAGENLLSAFRDIGHSSGAAVFAKADGTLTIVDRLQRQAGLAGTAYAITESGMVPEGSLSWDRSWERVANTVTVTSDYNGMSFTASDPVSIGTDGIVGDTLDNKSMTGADIAYTAQWRLALRKDQSWRVGQVTFDLMANNDTTWDLLAGWELASADRLDFTAMLTTQAPAGRTTFFVESIALDINVDERRVTWTADLSDASLWLKVATSGVRGDLSIIGW